MTQHTTPTPPDPATLPWNQPKPKRPFFHSFVIGVKGLAVAGALVMTLALLTSESAADAVGAVVLTLLALMVAGTCHLIDRRFRAVAARRYVDYRPRG